MTLPTSTAIISKLFYSSICKHLDSGTVSVLLVLYFSTLHLKLNQEYEVKMQTVTFNLRIFTSVLADPLWNFWEMKI